MRYHDLNGFLDGFLSLLATPADSSKARIQLIEEAASVEDIEELLEQWVLIHDLGFKDLLRMKTWFQLSHRQLATIFHCSQREIAQHLKSQRAQQLPAYPTLAQKQEEGPSEGMSCFMVEQYLSSWMDGEIQDVRVIQSLRYHLDQCTQCLSRAQLYRQLQSAVLSGRRTHAPITEDEWILTLQHSKERQRKWLLSFIFYFLVFGALLTLAIVFIILRPEKVPNIYELP